MDDEQGVTLADFDEQARKLAPTRELLFLLAAVVEAQEERIRALEQPRREGE